MGSSPCVLENPAYEIMEANMETVITKRSDYIPRKCSITNSLLSSKDHASVQMNVGHVDQYGIYTNDYTVFCLSGGIRRQGESDQGLNRLAVECDFMSNRILILLFASAEGDTPKIEEILAAGADKNTVDLDGNSVADLAGKANPDKRDAVLELLK